MRHVSRIVVLAWIAWGPWAVAGEAGTGRPSVLVFSRGFDCLHCTEQYQAFEALAPEFERRGVRVRFVLDRGGPVAAARPPIAVGADDDGSLARRHFGDGPRPDHATLVFGPGGGLAWKHAGPSPFLDARAVLASAVATEVAVEVEIADTPGGGDDYLTWAPTPARARLSRNAPGGGAARVVLTNDPERPTPAGRARPPDGNLAFAAAVGPGQTAAQSSLELSLPADGSWAPFVVAGAFPRASAADKDAILEVHLDSAAGPTVGTLAAMVRVRKDINSLTADEQAAFLKALHDLQFVKGRYELFPRTHDLAAKGKEDYTGPITLPNGDPSPNIAAGTYWPDQAHRGSAFLAWHRAFLLLMERELQAIDPAVTIPYWRQNAETAIFNTAFLGINKDALAGVYQSEVLFSPANWLYGWSIAYQDLKTVVRSPKDYTILRRPNGKTLIGDVELFDPAHPLYPDYVDFHANLETDPHNRGHALIGAWHANCLISPSDPSFWPFHSEDDRLWAKWQWFHGRFDADGASTSSYDFNGAFRPDDPASTFLGHNLKDPMWPWDGTSGRVVVDRLGKGNRPPEPGPHPFPKAPAAALWPEADARPAPADMIDYLGMAPGRRPLGVCYDDVPYGVQVPSSPAPPPSPTSSGLASLLADVARDHNSPFERRSRAIQAFRSLEGAPARELLDELAADRRTPLELRRDALAGLIETRAASGVERIFRLHDDGGPAAGLARELAVEFAPLVHLGRIPQRDRARFHNLLASIADDPDDRALAARASIALARIGDASGAARVLDLAGSKGPTAIPRAEIAAAIPPGTAGSATILRDVLKKAIAQNDEETTLVSLRALAGDLDSRKVRADLVGNDMIASPRVQRAALRSLMRESPDGLQKSIAVLEGTIGDDDSLKLEAAGTFRVALETQGPYTPADLAAWKARVVAVQAAAPASSGELRQALAMTLVVFDRLAGH